MLPSTYACVRDFGERQSNLIEEENVFWDSRVFSAIAWGRDIVGHHHEPGKGDYDVYITWVRLKRHMKGADGPGTLLAATTHLTHETCVNEVASHTNPRHIQSIRCAQTLCQLRLPDEPVVFGGDLNDPLHPTRLLFEHAGMKDCFFDLGVFSPPTWPSFSGDLFRKDSLCRGSRTFDWLFTTDELRSIVATVLNFSKNSVFPSDHLPVLAVFEYAARNGS